MHDSIFKVYDEHTKRKFSSPRLIYDWIVNFIKNDDTAFEYIEAKLSKCDTQTVVLYKLFIEHIYSFVYLLISRCSSMLIDQTRFILFPSELAKFKKQFSIIQSPQQQKNILLPRIKIQKKPIKIVNDDIDDDDMQERRDEKSFKKAKKSTKFERKLFPQQHIEKFLKKEKSLKKTFFQFFQKDHNGKQHRATAQ